MPKPSAYAPPRYQCLCGEPIRTTRDLSAHRRVCPAFWQAIGNVFKAFEDRHGEALKRNEWDTVKTADYPSNGVLAKVAGGWEDVRAKAGRPPAQDILPRAPRSWRGLLPPGSSVSPLAGKAPLYELLIGVIEVARLEANEQMSHWASDLPADGRPAVVEDAKQFLEEVRSRHAY